MLGCSVGVVLDTVCSLVVVLDTVCSLGVVLDTVCSLGVVLDIVCSLPSADVLLLFHRPTCHATHQNTVNASDALTCIHFFSAVMFVTSSSPHVVLMALNSIRVYGWNLKIVSYRRKVNTTVSI